MTATPATPADGATLWIDLSAVRENFRSLARHAAPARLAAVVKADAYGLGAGPVSEALAAEGCRDFFVAHLSEALELKPVLPEDARLYVLNGLAAGREPACAAAGVLPVLNSLDQAERWSRLAPDGGAAPPAVLQIDSGMSRLGLPEAEVRRLAGDADLLGRLRIDLLMSHLACADEPDHPANAAQAEAFDRLAAALPDWPRSLANSHGALLGPRFRHHLVRSGVFLFGGVRSQVLSPRPVVRLTAPVVQVRDVPAGAGVGYGFAHVTRAPARIATVALGYADGWSWNLAEGWPALFDGQTLPVAGRVSMDSITLDVTAFEAAGGRLQPGDEVEFLGAGRDIVDAAEAAGTIPYEILTRMGRRLQRRYVGGPGPLRQQGAASR